MSGTIQQVTDFAERLDKARIAYHLESSRPNAVMVCATVPGERWEIEFLTDGTIEVEIFKSDGEIADSAVLESLFAKFSDSK